MSESTAEQTCLVCGAPLSEGILPWHRRCHACGYEAALLAPSINDQKIHAKVDESGRAAGLQDLRQKNFEKILSVLKSLRRDNSGRPRLLDVGAAHGWFLDAAKGDFEAEGVEPDQAVFAATAARGVAVRQGFFPQALAPDERFDVITFNDVIEHIPDIRRTLQESRRHLNENGLLVLNLPNSRGVFYRVAKVLARLGPHSFFSRLWQTTLPSPHLHYFNIDNLKRLVESEGFEEIFTAPLDAVSSKGLFQRVHHTGDTSKSASLAIACGVWLASPLLKLFPSDVFLAVFRKSFPKKIWIFLAHSDDEFFIYSAIALMKREGHEVFCVFTTDGAGNGDNPKLRLAESQRALGKIGVPPEAIFDVGIRLGVADGTSFRNLNRLYEACLPLIRQHGLDEAILPAWEGGHVDHDATHLLGRALAKEFSAKSVREFSLYNAAGMPRGLFRVLRPLPDGRPLIERRLKLTEGWRHFWSLLHYPSQWKTFIGLGPEAFWRLVVRRQEKLRDCLVGRRDYRTQPHEGALFYERRFEVGFKDFAAATDSFIKEHLENV